MAFGKKLIEFTELDRKIYRQADRQETELWKERQKNMDKKKERKIDRQIYRQMESLRIYFLSMRNQTDLAA